MLEQIYFYTINISFYLLFMLRYRMKKGGFDMYPILIYYGDEGFKQIKISKILNELKLSYKVIDDSMLHQTLGYLMGLEHFEENMVNETNHFEFDLMVFPALEDETILELSKRLKAEDAYVERRAMITDSNRHWQLKELLVEINKEHHYFEKRSLLQQLIMECATIDQSKVTASFQKAFLDAYDSLTNQNNENEYQIDEAYANLQKELISIK